MVDMHELIQTYMKRYLPKREIVYRLPVSVPIGSFWPQLQQARRENSYTLPLLSTQGENFWWVLTETIEQQTEAVLEIVRSDLALDEPPFDGLQEDVLFDEAYCSSVIEGADAPKEAARTFIRSGRPAADKSEQMIRNNYEAMFYVLAHIDDPITETTVQDIFSLITAGLVKPQQSYRTEDVVVQSARGEIVHRAPSADQVPTMMRQWLDFVGDEETPPLLKACIAHFYFVYVHPFADGNGRTARALTYMLLLQSGYGFFRYISISDILAGERGRYYRAIRDVEQDGLDMTYFIEYYTGMLMRTVEDLKLRLTDRVLQARLLDSLAASSVNPRLMEGTKWMLSSDSSSITIKDWQKKFGVAMETARQDLFQLEAAGILQRRKSGRKFVFEKCALDHGSVSLKSKVD